MIPTTIIQWWLDNRATFNRSEVERSAGLPPNALNPYQLNRQGLTAENAEKLMAYMTAVFQRFAHNPAKKV